MGPVKSAVRYIGNQYIIIVINYITKWVEVKALCDNRTKSAIKFIYGKIITCFGYPTHFANDQCSHFIKNY